MTQPDLTPNTNTEFIINKPVQMISWISDMGFYKEKDRLVQRVRWEKNDYKFVTYIELKSSNNGKTVQIQYNGRILYCDGSKVFFADNDGRSLGSNFTLENLGSGKFRLKLAEEFLQINSDAISGRELVRDSDKNNTSIFYFLTEKQVNDTKDFYPNWMDRTESIKKKKLAEICFPGTHDTGCSNPKSSNSYVTQNYLLCDQASIGVRYFDIRLKYNDGKIYLIHPTNTAILPDGVFKELKYEINLLKKFIKKHPTEILFVDITQTDNWSEEADLKLFSIIQETIGDYILGKDGRKSTYEKIIGLKNQRVYFSYSSWEHYEKSPFKNWDSDGLIGESIGAGENGYANTSDIKVLKKYIIKNLKRNNGITLRRNQCMLTPAFFTSGPRHLALVEPAATLYMESWMKNDDFSHFINIVQTDFPSQHLIDALINRN